MLLEDHSLGFSIATSYPLRNENKHVIFFRYNSIFDNRDQKEHFAIAFIIELCPFVKWGYFFGGIIFCELRVVSCELRVVSCELVFTHILRVASCELRVASCELRVASCELRVGFPSYQFILLLLF